MGGQEGERAKGQKSERVGGARVEDATAGGQGCKGGRVVGWER